MLLYSTESIVNTKMYYPLKQSVGPYNTPSQLPWIYKVFLSVGYQFDLAKLVFLGVFYLFKYEFGTVKSLS